MTTCELRLKAAEIIEERGWWQGGFKGPSGECCLVEAMQKAESSSELFLVSRAVRSMGFRGVDESMMWNDAPERTKAEVVARLRDGCQPEVR